MGLGVPSFSSRHKQHVNCHLVTTVVVIGVRAIVDARASQTDQLGERELVSELVPVSKDRFWCPAPECVQVHPTKTGKQEVVS
jgi:hypothetical protein